MNEAPRVARFVGARLVADSGAGGVNTLVGGRFYRGQVDQGADLPAVVLQIVTAPDQSTLTGRHVYADVHIDVTVHGEGADYGPLIPIADRIAVVLQEASGVQDGVTIVKLRRVASVEFINTAGGKSYAHLVQTFVTEAVPV